MVGKNNRSHGAVIVQQTNRLEHRTYVIFGLVRGGTSMVAGVARGLGLNLGSELPDTHEDQQFVTQDPDAHVIPRAERNVHLYQQIVARNKEHAVWGWKYPQAAEYLDDIWGDIRNPHLICVFRDLTSVAMAHERWHCKTALRALNDLNVDVARNISLLNRVDCPRMMVSYEKALRHPDNFVEQLAEFCCLERNPDFDHKGFMQPEVYKDIEGFFS